MYKADNINRPVLVTGIERSGASLIARILQMCGAWTGETNEMVENIRIKRMVDSYYDSFNIPIEGQYPLPDEQNLMIPKNWSNKVGEILLQQDYKAGQTWMYKGSRISQIWPVWHNSFMDARWIIVRRRTGDIINSCLKTAYMSAFKDSAIREKVCAENETEGWKWWIHRHEWLFNQIINEGCNVKIVWPERLVGRDYSQILDMLEWLGLEWNPEVINEIDPLLDKMRRK